MKKISKSKVFILLTGIFFIIGLAGSITTFAATAVDLGTASSFGVLAGAGITNTGTTTITGDIGSFTTTTISGAPTVIGTNHGGDSTTQLAKTALSTAYGNAAGQPCAVDLTGQDLGGLTLTPGVYCFSSSAQLTGILTLNGGNNPNAIFVFQIGSTLTTASSSSVSLINSAQSRNIFWQVGSSATLGTTTNFKGNILALTSITLTTGATVEGRMLAQNGSVTLDTNTITVPTALHLRKIVNNDNGGTAANTAWTLTATGTGGSPTNLSGNTPVDSGATFKADTYALAESGGSSGYTASTYSCVKNGGGAVVSNSITLVAGDDAICTITNDDIAPQLHLRKVINNTHSGIATVADFTLTANGTGANDLSGTSPVDSGAGLLADTFALSETSPGGYTASAWVCIGGTQIGSTITVGINESATCTITNSDVAQSLHLRNIVTNDNGGTAINTAWTLTATGTVVSPTNLSGTTPVDSGATFKTDTYTLAESGGPSGYTASTWVCVGGTQSGSTITVVSGESATCTITHNDIAPQLHLRKVVNNTHGGTATVANFTLTANGAGANDLSGTSPVDSGAGLLADTFALSETGPSGYTASAWNCVGGTQSGSNITVGINQSATCTITNDDVDPGLPPVPPLISVLKVPSPLSLPAGPGSVTYTYTLTNIGTVPVTNVTMVDDSCSPVTFVSGDTNINSQLDLAETWIYHCTITLSATHTNNVLATGWANGLSTTDAASATVVVGIPVVPPLIHVTKVPNPLSLPAGGGIVTYTETVTNPGTVALNNVTLIDDKCTPMAYISGDTNLDSKLDASETWTYTCQTNLSSTTTNIAIASGEANGLTATDTATATVVVAHASGGGSMNTVPPIIDVVKIPNPLALPKGPGPVTYTYTLHNIGQLSMSNITMVDDSCSPMKYVSGDTNNDTKLNTNETWTYTCSTTLSATHTNTVVATGWANGIRATDIAIATVVVGKPIVPPLIHVTKVPDPLTLPAGGGMVNYTEEVTNPGTVALSNVNLTDDKCSPVGYIFGDTNGNSKLDTNETWTYTCESNLTSTTTNTAMVTGEANGLTARDFAIVTVIVADQVPLLPDTGFPPSETSTIRNILILAGILILISTIFIQKSQD